MLTHFTILIIILFIISIFKNKLEALKYTMFILFFYLAIRYDYGTDYLNYYELFTDSTEYETESREVLFWFFFRLFNKYTYFIIFHTFLCCLTFYFFIKEYINKKYYILFILIFMLHPGLMYCMITAMRSALAAIFFLITCHFFYIKKRNVICFCLGTIVASLFHTSAIVLLILPFAESFIKRSTKYLIFIYILLLILSGIFINQIATIATNQFEIFNKYDNYVENGYMNIPSLGVIILRGAYLIPIFYMLKTYKNEGITEPVKKNFTISFFYFFILFLGLDFQNRYTIILFPYVIAALSYTLQTNKKSFSKITIYSTTLIIISYMNYIMYKIYMSDLTIQGNFINYQTIFSLSFLP